MLKEKEKQQPNAQYEPKEYSFWEIPDKYCKHHED